MAACGCDSGNQFAGLSAGYRRILWVVIAINVAMFVLEMVAGVAGQSMALKADALDFLGDSITYGMTLLVIGRPLNWRATAALVKGASLGVLGLWVFGATLYRVVVTGQPDEFVMGSVGMLAFAANLASALLLLRYRNGDANVRSVWLCSRNDAIGNLAVVAAAGGVFLSGSAWPDLAVAAVMAGLFLHSSGRIVQQAVRELQSHGGTGDLPRSD